MGEFLTRERWETALAVLRGEVEGSGISDRAAAKAAGVNIGELQFWVARSRERRLEDEEWVLRIAPDYDLAVESRKGRLEDEAWNRALNGTPEPIVQRGEVVGYANKKNDNLLLKMLGALDPRYAQKEGQQLKLELDLGDMFQKFQAAARLEAANLAKGKVVGPETEALPDKTKKKPVTVDSSVDL